MLGLGAIGLRTSRVRAALTMAGIAIGIAAMIGVLVISESSRSDLLAQLDRLGTNMLRVTAGQTLFGDSAELAPEARGMIGRVGPVESASAVAGSTLRYAAQTSSMRAGPAASASPPRTWTCWIRCEPRWRPAQWLDDASATLPTTVLGNTAARRTEIGLRRALGATRRHIAMQFVSEALALALVGGVLGVLLGAGLAVAYALSQGWTPIIPAVAIVGGIIAALAIGAIAGFYPAMRAARLRPTDALRGSE